jgi:DNA-binding SARP family transcriptional activator
VTDTLHLTLLGRCSLDRRALEGEAEHVLGPGKPLSLLAYLNSCPSRSASRDHLLELLWATHDHTDGDHALRQAVWYLRQRIGNDALVTRDGVVRLTALVPSDAAAFLAAVAQSQLEVAVAGYGGPFLPGLAVPGGAAFEAWADSERTRLRSLFIRSAEIVIAKWLHGGRTHDALALARRVRDENPLDEVGWRILLNSLTVAGDAVTARVEADALEELLRDEQRTAATATRKALQRARQVEQVEYDTPTATSGALVAELVGREREFSLLLQGWEQARRGSGGLFLVSAPPGLGKTRLLKDVATRIRSDGGSVVYLRAHPGERDVPAGFAGDLAAAIADLPGASGVAPACAATLVTLNPTLSSTFRQAVRERPPPDDLVRRRTLALADLLASVSKEQAIALLIDDVHWMDAVSNQIVSGCCRRAREHGILVVLAEREASIAQMDIQPDRQLRLAPLTTEDIRLLVASLGALPATDWASAVPALLGRASEGSPLLILEALQLALESGVLERTDRGWSCRDPTELEGELQKGTALRHRLEQLDRSDCWLLTLLAAAGTPLTTDALTAVTEQPRSRIAERVTSLEQRGFCSVTPSGLRCAHDTLDDMLLDVASPDARRTAHHLLGSYIATQAGGNAQMLVRAGRHLRRSGEESELRRVFRRRLRLARRTGERRPLVELAAEFLGTERDSEPTRRLYRSLPLHVRLGLDRPRRAVGLALAALLVAAATLGTAIGRNSNPPDATLFLYGDADGAEPVAFAIAARRAGWSAMEPLATRASRLETLRSPELVHGPVHPTPGGERWAYSQIVHDSGGTDVFVRAVRGGERRLTFAPGDDQPLGWSPDGAKLLVSSGRWHSDGAPDLAALDLETGMTVRLTYTDLVEHRAAWSLDGTRIAYSRSRSDESDWEMCEMDADGSHQRCYGIPGYARAEPLAWEAHGELLVLADSGGSSWLVHFSPVDGSYFPVRQTVPEYVRPSADGRWVACVCSSIGGGTPRWMVYPALQPELWRPIDVPESTAVDLHAVWVPRRATGSYLDRIRVAAPELRPTVGAPLRLTAHGFDSSEHPLEASPLRWSSDDPSIATVNEHGWLTPLQAGYVTVRVSAGGWREDSLTIEILPQTP